MPGNGAPARAVCVALAVALRAASIVRYRIDSDEPFSIGVPGPYSTLAADGSVLERGTWLEAGVYQAIHGGRAVVWSPAVERGVWPSRDLVAHALR